MQAGGSVTIAAIIIMIIILPMILPILEIALMSMMIIASRKVMIIFPASRFTAARAPTLRALDVRGGFLRCKLLGAEMAACGALAALLAGYSYYTYYTYCTCV